MAEGLVTTLLQAIDEAVKSYVDHGYNALVNSGKPLMILTITAYVAWIGWKTIHAWQGFSAGEFVKETLKIAIVYSLATNWGFFSLFMYDVLTNGPNEISGILLSAAGAKYDSTNAAMQAIFDNSFSVGSTLWNMGHLTAPIYWIFALCVWFFSSVLTGMSIVMVGVSKCFLGMLLALAPFMVFFYLSNTLRGVAESWFRLMLGFAFVPLMVNASLLFTNNMLSTGLEKAAGFSWGEITNACIQIAQMIFGYCICIVLLWKSAQIAAQMGNGVSVSCLEAASSMTRGAKGIGKGARLAGKGAMLAGKGVSAGVGMVGGALRWAGNKIRR